MKKRVAIIAAPGCEEGETLTIVDIIRRAELTCDIVGLESTMVTGAHNITFEADYIINNEVADYDMVVLPGGYGGADAMCGSELLLSLLQEMDRQGKYIAAICAAALVLDAAGLLEEKKYTCYPTVASKIHSGNRIDDKIVVHGNLITSQGPATAYAFAYKLVELLGGDAKAVQNRMVYFNAFDETGKTQPAGDLPACAYPETTIRAAVLMVEGFEEGETMQIVDLLRRAGIITHTFCFQENLFVLSMQGMRVKADKIFSDEIRDYDLIIVPGGRTAGPKLINDPAVIDMLQYFNKNNKLIAAMCSGTTVLKAADVIEGKRVTGYTGYAEKLTGAIFCEDVAVFDQNVVTSQGPATPYPFAFKIMEALGIDPNPMKVRLLYELAGGK